MRKFLVVLLAGVLLALAFTGCTPAQNNEAPAASSGTAEPLIVAMELAYPPFETKDEAGNPSGVSVDLAKAFGEYLGRDVKIENIAWDGLIPSLQTGKADMILSSMTITEERDKVVDFSNPYSNSMLAILVNKESGIKTVEDLNQAGKSIAIRNGTTGHIYAQNNLPNAELLALGETTACVTEVAQGKADGFIYDQLTIYRSYKENSETTEAVFIPFQDADMWGAAFAEGNTELRDEFNKFLETYKADGGFDTLTEKYLAEEKAAFDDFGFKWFFDLE